jgi:murein DD-endopeptidase MepM/ murein hydrolase activator NlpD
LPFLASLVAFSLPLLAAVVPNFGLHSSGPAPAQPPFPAPPGYLLPWPGGQIHTVTQGEETSLTHNGYAAYAFDFDLHYDVIVAARGGRVVMVRQDSEVGGCSSAFSNAANYVVIDHGDGTSGLYLHLAPDAVLVHVGQLVFQGDPIAVSGETGLTCSGDDSGPGLHLHFQVEKTNPARYFTQSLPIAFDDIAGNNGVPQEGKSYVSGNAGHGKTLGAATPHRAQRPFHPVARPADPTLLEGDKDAAPPPPPSPPSLDTTLPADADTPPPDPSITPRPSRTATPRPTHTPTPTPAPSDTAAPTDTPVPSDTPVPPAPTDTPPPPPTDTPVPQPTDTPTPEPPPDTPTSTETPSP